ncbi:hypothetical protein ACHAXT_007875 [Thalassiosira profunda]
MEIRGDELLGAALIGLLIAKHIETKKAAKAEGITYKEMKLRQKRARAAYKCKMAKKERRQRKWKARVEQYDEQLARFQATRDQQARAEATTEGACRRAGEYCTQCGTSKVDGAKFCGACGAKRSEKEEATQEMMEYLHPANQ